MKSIIGRNSYLFHLLFERGSFLFVNLLQMIILLVRLRPEVYIDYIILLNYSSLIGVVSRLGIEIFYKINIPRMQRSTNNIPTIQKEVLKIAIIPMSSLILFSFATYPLFKLIKVQFNLSIIQYAGIIILLSTIGLLYELQVAYGNPKLLWISLVIASISRLLMYYFLLPLNTGFNEFISVFLLTMSLSFIVMLIILIYSFTRPIEKSGNDEQLYNFKSGFIPKGRVREIQSTFLLLLSGMFLRLGGISLMNYSFDYTYPVFILLITLLDASRILFSQFASYLMITPSENNQNIKINKFAIYSIATSSILGVIISYIVLRVDLFYSILNIWLPNYSEGIDYALMSLFYPMIVLMLSSNIFEGYVLKSGKLKELAKFRIIGSLLFGILIVIVMIYSLFTTFSLIFIFLIILGQFIIVVSSILLIRPLLKYTYQFVLLLLSISVPLLSSIILLM